MRLQYSDLGSGMRLIKLSGALDIHGLNDVELEFVSRCTGENLCILVDLSKVNYISSIGIPLLVNSAKSIARHGGKMVLLKPQKTVEGILELTGISLIIPIYQNLNTAVLELKK
ncbi:MAG TPA: STAS domain-containing protein [Anaerolineales bacterium]|nr:STAS domain-containing protein [Anaerolineales bacterium]